MKIPDRNANALCKIKITQDSIVKSTVIKLDSVLSSTATGRLFFGHSEDDLDYIKKMTLKNYELIFLREIENLYRK